MTGLSIAPGLTLPIEAVTETFVVLAKRGKGKTNTAVVMTEEMVRAGHPVIVLDPVGVWWGIRSSADGKSEGLPMAILGGDHGDLPLSPESGALVAETLVKARASAVIDLSALSKTQARRFATDFIETLYHRNREPLHVIVDEADEFAPQRSRPDVARLLGAMEDLVRRGRARGLGVTLITQRPAVLNKDVLTQAEVLIALGMTGVRDVAAIDEWVRLHADEEQARQVKASLPSLPVGTAWVWSPGWLDILQKVKVRRRTTFDSSATPKPGEKRLTATTVATVDIDALGEQMAALREEATANDPKALRAEIAALRRAQASPAAPERIEVIPDALRQAVTVTGAVSVETMRQITDAMERMQQVLDEAGRNLARQMAVLSEALNGSKPAGPVAMPRIPRPEPVRVDISHLRSVGPAAPTDGDTMLPKAQRLILTVLATYGTRPVASVGNLSGYSSKGGGFRNALSALRTAGYIEGRGDLTITAAGREALGYVEPLPTGADLREHWKSLPAVGGAAAKVLDVLAERYPESVPIEEIAEATDYSPAGGGFRNALSRLRSLGLAHGRGEMRLDDDLAG